MKNYIRIARPDHWIKNIFVIPGIVFAIELSDEIFSGKTIIFNAVVGMIAMSNVGSWR